MSSLKDRIRKVLAVSQSTNNEAEAMAFMEKAYAMLAENNLTIEQVLEADRPALDTDDAPMGAYSHGWQHRLNLAVGRLYFCTFFRLDHPDGSCRFQFVGERHNLDVANLMADYLAKTGRRLAKQAAHTDPVAKRRYTESFLEAYSVRVAERIRALLEPAKADGPTNLPAVITLHQQAQTQQGQWLVEVLGDSVSGKVPSTKVVDVPGLREGYKAGDEVGLHTQVGSTKQGRLT